MGKGTPKGMQQSESKSTLRYIIGVDAGGTYTDAVLIEAATGNVVASAKRPTTHYHLSKGIHAALEAVLSASAVSPEYISTVSVSTTLATNALVEGKGADVGLFVIGFNQRLQVPAAAARYIPGGHTVKGEEVEPLGIPFVVDALQELHGAVDAWAVCGQMAFVNPAHELVTAKAIDVAARVPVFCSHQASNRAGMKERSSTAVLNAQLLPVMKAFLQQMTEALQQLGLCSAVVIVRGDATSMNMEDALLHAADTVASGPAATALYGACQTGEHDALIVDVGGTTTDITLIRGGKPVINAQGMVIGSWETHVEAVEMFTVGVGGDSFVRMGRDGKFSLGPERVVPLSIASGIPSPSVWIGAERNSQCVAAAAGITVDCDVVAENALLAFLVKNGPATTEEIMEALDIAEITVEQQLKDAFRRQYIVAAGFTPTDALHVLEKLHIGDISPAVEAAVVLGGIRGQGPKEFARSVIESVEQKIEETVLHHVTQREVGGQLAAFLAKRSDYSLVTVDVSLDVPIIGIGAAAKYLLPHVAERLKTTSSFPEYHEVGNALGAAFMALRAQ